jgi:AcrR family transcriptional regulator
VATSQARTRLARAAVTGAARALFLERGYAATTIDAVSELSGVPQATVYRLFSSKLGLLRTLLDDAIAGDSEVPGAPAHAAAMLACPDPGGQLTQFASIARGVISRGGSIHQILAGAASSDSQAAGLLAEYTRRREQGQGQVACSLAQRRQLRPGMTEQDAADIVHALASPEVYRLLVIDRGWSPGRYEKWLAATLISQLLPKEETQ